MSIQSFLDSHYNTAFHKLHPKYRYGTFGTIPMIENHDVQGVEYEIVEIEEDI